MAGYRPDMVRLLSGVTTVAVLCDLLVAQPSFDPTANVVLDTDFTIVTPAFGAPYPVTGGVFVFRDVNIAQGITVRGTGSKPLVFLVTGRMTVHGVLDVSGGDGERVTTLQAANFSTEGGVGGPNGGRGGTGSPRTTGRSYAGQSGNGPRNLPGAGGSGGIIALLPTRRGSGGAGGAFATQGDPDYPASWIGGTAFVQQLGLGGFGGLGVSGSATRALVGGGPGGSPFSDGDPDNDFFGTAYDVNRARLIRGELPLPTGGSGGGGGGDEAASPLGSGTFVNDARGGGGGGGGGCVVVYALGEIVVSGAIQANGGNGGGGEIAGSSSNGGGGGGGSGGMIVLASETRIDLHAQGDLFSNDDYQFALSADGGISQTGLFSSPIVTGKYPANGVAIGPTFGANYDSAPLGGLGGNGVIQLATPPGGNLDNTNTVLDDGIRILRLGVPLTGAQKTRALGWRGFRDTNGVPVDDFGNPTSQDLGEVKPAPILMPLLR